MAVQEKRLKIELIAFLILGILSLHYSTLHEKIFQHAVYRMLFYFPLVLGSFWFGLWGSIFISTAVVLLYLPFVISRWQGIAYDFNKILEGFLFVFIAFVMGCFYSGFQYNVLDAVGPMLVGLVGSGRALRLMANTP